MKTTNSKVDSTFKTLPAVDLRGSWEIKAP